MLARMWLIARKNLTGEPIRLLMTIGGVAFAFLLILVIVGLYRGFQTRITRYFESIPADLWVAQEGVRDIFHSPSVLPLGLEEKLRAIAGVEDVNRFTFRLIQFDHEGMRLDAMVMGFDTEKDYNGPPTMETGERVPRGAEVVVDRVFARKNRIALGDELELANASRFKVVGIAKESNLVFNQFFFIPLAEAEALFDMAGRTNFFHIQREAGADLEQVKAAVLELGKLDVIAKDEFIENHRQELLSGFLPILSVLSVIALVIAGAIISLTLYNTTIEKAREYGILKAIGADNRQLFYVVAIQALAAAIGGVALGSALGLLLLPQIEQRVPEFVTAVVGQDLALLSVGAIIVALVAALLPARRLSRIDPAIVFRA